MNMILMLVGVLLVYIILQYIYRRYWSKDLSVQVEFQTDHAVKGDVIYLQEQVINNKWLPLPYIYVKFQLSKEFQFMEKDGNSSVSDQTYRNDVFSLLFYQKITRRIPLKCLRRGVYDINDLNLVFAGIFMNETMVKQQRADSRIVVYPEAFDTQQLEVPFRHVMGNLEKRRYLLQDRFVFRGIREYESYDSMRDINWNATARTGNLMVNEFDETRNQKVCILLNLEPEGMLRQDHLSEASISIAAGLAQMFIERGIQVSLFSNGCDIYHEQPLNLSYGSGSLHLNGINAALALIDLSIETPDFTEMLTRKKQEESEENAAVYVMVSANKRDNLVAAVNHLVSDPLESLWIIPFHSGMDYELKTSAIPSVPWEVGYDK